MSIYPSAIPFFVNNSRTDDRPQAETKPLVDANVGSNKRINATAWAAMKSKLGL